MEVKTSQTTLWDVIHSPPWEQQKRWVLTEFKGWPQMNGSPQDTLFSLEKSCQKKKNNFDQRH
jgi:hypothetical protein